MKEELSVMQGRVDGQNLTPLCHPERGDSLARDLTWAGAINAVDGSACAACSQALLASA